MNSGVVSKHLLHIDRANFVQLIAKNKAAHKISLKVVCARNEKEEFTRIASFGVASEKVQFRVLHRSTKGKKTIIHYTMKADGEVKIETREEEIENVRDFQSPAKYNF